MNVSTVITTVDTNAKSVDNRRSPEQSGVYFFKDVSNLLRVTDRSARAKEFSLSPQQISGWAKKGFAGVQIDGVFSNHRFIRFPDLITLRMVAILRSHGISLIKTTLAHEFLSDALGTTHPFVDRALWVDDVEMAVDIYAEFDDLLVNASRRGQLVFSEIIRPKVIKVANLTFDENRHAATWAPHQGVVIDPAVHSGASCLKGTRLSTRLLYNMHVAGEEKNEIADWYELDPLQVEAAISWEERLAA